MRDEISEITLILYVLPTIQVSLMQVEMEFRMQDESLKYFCTFHGTVNSLVGD
mgnify:CR=1 FL=1